MESNNLVLMEALAEVTAVMREGVQHIFSQETGKFERVPFSELDRDGREGLLAYGVDWTEYVNCGMEEIDCDRIIMNALDGKPQEQWLDPIALENERPVEHESADIEAIIVSKVTGNFERVSFAEFLESYASPEPAAEIDHGHER